MAATPQTVGQATLLNIVAKKTTIYLILLIIVISIVHVFVSLWVAQSLTNMAKTPPKKLVEVTLLPPPTKPKPEPLEQLKPEPKIKPKPKLEKPKPVIKKPELPKPVLPKKAAPTPAKPVKVNKPEPPKPIQRKPVEQPKPAAAPRTEKPINKPVEQPRYRVLTQKTTTTASGWSAPKSNAPIKSTATGNPFGTATKPVVKPVPKANTSVSGQGQGGVSSDATVISKVKPSYPMRAKSRNTEGWVSIELTVTASGSVTNPRVIGASPSGYFEASALAAIQQYRFKPKMVNGKAVETKKIQKVIFKLD